jgi:hypothetical protein
VSEKVMKFEIRVKSRVKVKFALKQTMKGQRGE